MYVYLDESGDTGFKFLGGSSRYFVIALILVDDPLPIHQAVHDVRLAIGWEETREFIFSKTHHDGRIAFFKTVRAHPFAVRLPIVDKTRLESPALRKKENFYNYLVKLALSNDIGMIANATLVIDESFKGKNAQKGLATYLRRELNATSEGKAPKLSKIIYHKSHQDNLLQVADMMVGAVARAFEVGDDQYRRLMRGKIQDLWVYPPVPEQNTAR